MQESQSTEGEKIIEIFLEMQGIKFEREFEINGLEGDTKRCRRADFYLPRYKVYLEFLGGWNHPEYRALYNEKKDIYELNEIPCVYIYPDNLGTLEFIFRWRLEEELEKWPELGWQLWRFRMGRLKIVSFICLMFWLVPSLLFVVCENINNKHLIVGDFSVLGFLIFTLFAIGAFIYGAKLIFFKKR